MFISDEAVTRLSWDGGVTVRGAPKERIALTVSEVGSSSRGSNVGLTLVSCPNCRNGFFESYACFFAQWDDEKPDNRHEDWLCDSKEVDAEQVVFLKRIAAAADREGI